MSLEGRVAIVTGAGSGIGKAIAIALARAGAHVATVDIDPAAAKATGDAVTAVGRRGLALDADVGDVASIDGMVGRVTAALGAPDVLVNNAGVTWRAYLMDLTEADWDRIMRVNGKGVFFAALQLARHNINVNTICPGTTVTALSQDNLVTRARDEGIHVEEMERRRNSAILAGSIRLVSRPTPRGSRRRPPARCR